MANPASTNTSEIPSFTAVTASDRYCIELRAEGNSYVQIAVGLKQEFGIEKSERTIREWFIAGGRLEQAYMDYNQLLADASVRRAKQLAQKHSETAIATMVDLLRKTEDSNVRLGAAKALANKYIPDRQVVIGKGNEDDVPSELADEGEDALNGIRGDTTTDEGSPADQPPDGDSADADIGGGETASEEAGQPQV